MTTTGCEVCGKGECDDIHACVGELIYRQHPDAVLERKRAELLATGQTSYDITLEKPIKCIHAKFKFDL